VVERPASVVKELLENAIDAGSQHIQIDIERGGSSLIRVIDDGVGIAKSELALAVSRHATSKLSTLNELEHIASLGFRGEALASISAVSRLSIQSKPKPQTQAWQINTGTDTDFANYRAEPEPVAGSTGTIVEVRELFFNTPARRKFMRTVKTEFKHIDNVFKRIALSRFDIAFKLSHNKKVIRNLPGAETSKAIESRIGRLFSNEFLANSYRIDLSSNHFSQMGTIRLWGWVSKPHWHRSQPDWQYFYVNGRFIRDKLVNHALRQACQELLPSDSYLSYLLYLEIDPGQVDVNVHPTKHEVRFRQTRLVHDFIYSALHRVLEPSAYGEPSASKESSADKEPSAGQQPSADQEPVITGSTENNTATLHSDRDKSVYYNPYSSVPYQKNSSALSRKDVADHLEGMQKLYQSPTQQTDSGQTSAAEKQNFFGTCLDVLIPDFILSQNKVQADEPQLYLFQIKALQQYILQHVFTAGERTQLLIPQTVVLKPRQVDDLINVQKALEQWGLEIGQIADDSLMVRSLPDLQDIPGCIINLEKLLEALSVWLKEQKNLQADGQEPDISAAATKILLNTLQTTSLSLAEQNQLLTILAGMVRQSSPVPLWNKQPLWLILDKDKLSALFNNS